MWVTWAQLADRIGQVEYRKIGVFDVSLLGLGTSRLASLGSRRTKADARALLATAKDCGINVIDTADTYGSTAAERWIGELTRYDAEYWVIATKSGLATVDLPGPLRALNQPVKKLKQLGGARFSLDPKALRRNVERSLHRLRRDRIEIFLLHLPPDGIANDDEMRDILQDVQRSGIIAEFGVSTDNLSTIRDVQRAWGSRCAETGINPLQPAPPEWDASDLELIANHVMAAASERLPAADDEPGRPTPSIRERLIRHAAASQGVKVVLTGTSSPQHLRDNAAALDRVVTAADLIV